MLVSIGSHGDVHPFVGLGHTLLARGHRVSIVANGHFESLIRGVGLDFIPLGTDEEYRKMAGNADLWRGRKATQVVLNATIGLVPKVYELVAARVVQRQTVVAASSLGLGARVARDVMDFPLATIHLQPSVFRSVVDPPTLPGLPGMKWWPKFIIRRVFDAADKFILDKIVAPPINEIRKAHNLPSVRKIFQDYWHSPDLVIGMFPDWFAHPAADWPAQTKLTGFPLWDERSIGGIPQALYDFLNAGEPPVVFTPGSAMWHAEKFFQTAIDACDQLNRRGILLTRHRDHLPKVLPPYVRHFEYAPFSQLLPSVAALVHHGGIGTSSQALAAGVRQVVCPMAHDQFDNAARMEKLGVARVIPAAKLTASRLAAAIKSMFENRDFYVRAHWVSEWFTSEQALTETAKLLEQFGKSRNVTNPPMTAAG